MENEKERKPRILKVWNKKIRNYSDILIDEDDWNRVSCYTWYIDDQKSRGKLMFKITCWHKDVYTSLARYIMRVLDPKIQVDHIDRNIFNNQKSNLRLCSNMENNRNKTKQRNNKSGYKGVCFDNYSRSYKASIMVSKKSIHLGRFENPEDAAVAYDKAAKRYFGEFAVLNFPNS